MKLTIIIPAYNQEKYLRQSLDSVINQKVNFDYEIITSDDNSTDSSLQILKDYQSKYPQLIKIINNNKNIGLPKITHQMHSAAQGEYIAILDGDDYLTDQNRFQEQVDFLDKNKDYSAVAGNTIIKYIDEIKEDSLIVEKPIPQFHEIADFIMASTYFHTSAIMYRNIYRGKVPEFLKHEFGRGDWLRTIMHAQHGKIGYIDKIVSVYRVHNGGIWSGLTSFKKFSRNLNSCYYFNKFLGYRYDNLFKKRIELFYTYILQNYNEEMNLWQKLYIKIRFKLFLLFYRARSEFRKLSI